MPFSRSTINTLLGFRSLWTTGLGKLCSTAIPSATSRRQLAMWCQRVRSVHPVPTRYVQYSAKFILYSLITMHAIRGWG